MTDLRSQIVQAGYDALIGRYTSWSARIEGDPRHRFLDELSQRLPTGAIVLDLGCGAGVPSTKQLAERFKVVGVDFSDAQLRLARANVPDATFIHADMAELEFEVDSFDAVTSFYVISHVPREQHARLFEQIMRWLRPGGFFLASLGARDSPDWTGEWLGVRMFFSSHDADTNRRLLQRAGFNLLLDEIVSMQEPEPDGTATFLWVLARKPQEGAG